MGKSHAPRTVLVLAALTLAACAGAAPSAHAQAPAASAAASQPSVAASATKPAAPAPPRDVAAGAVLGAFPHDVILVLDVASLRSHPVGRNLGPMIASMPQWRDLLRGVVRDPVREIDWVYVTGPSLNNTSKDGILVHHQLAPAAIEDAIDKLHQRSAQVNAFDAHVLGVKATIGTFDRASRVLLRAEPYVLAVVPPDSAESVAKILVGAHVTTPVTTGETLRLAVHAPHAELAMVPAEVHDAVVVVVARPDGGLDVAGEGACDDEAAAVRAEDELHALLSRYDNFIVRVMTRNLLNAIHIQHEGSKLHLRLAATREQVETVLGLLASVLGASIDDAHQPQRGVVP